MLKFFISVCFISIILISFNSHSENKYYKCVTEKGTTFSQSPCNELATTYKITTVEKSNIPKVDYAKPLNDLERTHIITSLQRKLRKEHYKLAVLKRHSDGAKYTPPEDTQQILQTKSESTQSNAVKNIPAVKKAPPTRIEKIEARIEEIREKIALYQ